MVKFRQERVSDRGSSSVMVAVVVEVKVGLVFIVTFDLVRVLGKLTGEYIMYFSNDVLSEG